METNSRNTLRYHRIIVVSIVIVSIWITYHTVSGDWKYANGQERVIGSRIHDMNEGEWTWYYENGNKRMQGYFIHGKRTGIWKTWDEGGHLLTESNYSDDKLNGSYIQYDVNGVKEQESMYKDDILIETRKNDQQGVNIH